MSGKHHAAVLDSVRRLLAGGTDAATDDAMVLERFLRRGDTDAFEAILRVHGPMVLGACRRLLDDPHDVDDAFQATFLIFVRKAGSIRDRRVLGPWLHGVARRVAVRVRVDARRRRGRERNGLGTTVLDAEAPHTGSPEADEFRTLLDEEIAKLPPRHRAALVLCDLEGRTHEQAAAELRCPVGTVKSRLARGRDRLRDRLVRRGLAPAPGLLAPALRLATPAAVPPGLAERTLAGATRLLAGQAMSAATGSSTIATLTQGVLRSMSLPKLPLTALALLAAGIATTGAWLRARPPSEPPRLAMAAPPQPPRAGDEAADPSSHVGRFRLDNGLTVLIRPIQGASQTALVVLYSIGSDHDPVGRCGLGHLVEHAYLTAAAGDAKPRTIDEFLRRYPSGANGQTGDRYTVFATTFPDGELDRELQDAADRMGRLRIVAGDLDRERPRLLAEVENMFANIPSLAAQNNARELVRPSPRGGRHGGLADDVKRLTPEAVQSHWARYYKPRNAILAVSGSVDPKAARRAITAHFAALPSGEAAPTPGEPGPPRFGEVRDEAVGKTFDPNARSTATLAYVAPAPTSPLYAPFLVLVSRFWAAAGKLNDEPNAWPVYFTPLDDGAIIAFSAPARAGETKMQTWARLEAFVAGTIAPRLAAHEGAAVQNSLGFFLGTTELPDPMLARNPYGVAFSLGRRDQLRIDPPALRRALETVSDDDLRRVANEVFAPGKHSGAYVAIKP